VPTRLRQRLATAIPRSGDRTRALPVQIDGAVARWPDAGGSHQLARAAAADGLVLIDPGEGRVEAGAEVDVAPFAGP
jgi:molybdopterin biosynthesis enzyme